MTRTNAIKIFEEKKVRTIWDDETEEWYFSIVDVVSILTDSIDGRKYWNKLKQRLKSIEIRKDLTDEWRRHGLQEGIQFATLTDIIYQTWAGKTAKEKDWKPKPANRLFRHLTLNKCNY